MLRIIRVISTLSCVVIYVPIFTRMYKNIRAHYAMSNYNARNQRKLLRMTLTIFLITSNTIVLFTVPDIILILYPDYSSNLFYVLNLNKGVINVIIFLATQRTLRRAVIGKPDISMQMQSMKINPKTTTVFDPVLSKTPRNIA